MCIDEQTRDEITDILNKIEGFDFINISGKTLDIKKTVEDAKYILNDTGDEVNERKYSKKKG